ncbi:MAG TPA: hypothetical protein VFA04_09560 [Bryobacteraceae bacterium]|nr:hypothetical protein [Bryobacteraceae bacterium]
MRDRTIYALVGGVAGSVVGYGLRRWLMIPVFFESCLTLAGGLGMVAWAERTKRVKTPDELNQPLSVFDAPKRQ